jgi:hypothetical protein
LYTAKNKTRYLTRKPLASLFFLSKTKICKISDATMTAVKMVKYKTGFLVLYSKLYTVYNRERERGKEREGKREREREGKREREREREHLLALEESNIGNAFPKAQI